MTRALLFILMLLTTPVLSQSKIYKLKITTTNGQTKSGYLREMSDSSITISPQPLLQSKTETIAYKNIKSLKARDRRGLVKGTFIGFAGGALLGAIIGYATYQKPNCQQSWVCLDFGPGLDAVAGAIIGGVSGALIGVAVGSASTKVDWNYPANKPAASHLEKFLIQPKK